MTSMRSIFSSEWKEYHVPLAWPRRYLAADEPLDIDVAPPVATYWARMDHQSKRIFVRRGPEGATWVVTPSYLESFRVSPYLAVHAALQAVGL